MRKVRREVQSTNIESHFIDSYHGKKICKMPKMQKMGLGKYDTKGKELTNLCERHLVERIIYVL